MKRFWISWYQSTEDYRPLRDPPDGNVLGWWCSGYRENDASICALVSGSNSEDACKAVQVDWPEAAEHRFVDEVGDNWGLTIDFL
jgi:hypothetical protein